MVFIYNNKVYRALTATPVIRNALHAQNMTPAFSVVTDCWSLHYARIVKQDSTSMQQCWLVSNAAQDAKPVMDPLFLIATNAFKADNFLIVNVQQAILKKEMDKIHVKVIFFNKINYFKNINI